jgi:hypothetical protein
MQDATHGRMWSSLSLTDLLTWVFSSSAKS